MTFTFELDKIYCGDAVEVLRDFPDGCIDMICTSPPYFSLRDYKTASWEGGDIECDHVANPRATKKFGNPEFNVNCPSREKIKTAGYYASVCPGCGAIRTDKQIGLEKSPELYIEKLVAVFREVRRVLKDTGLVWLVLGDTYWGGKGMSARHDHNIEQRIAEGRTLARPEKLIDIDKLPQDGKHPTLKPKDLCMIPARTAIALQEDGWWLRSDIIWKKLNPMPESVIDRPTSSHEHIFLLAKSKTYYYDIDAIREPHKQISIERDTRGRSATNKYFSGESGRDVQALDRPRRKKTLINPNTGGRRLAPEPGELNALHPLGRNRRDVWEISTASYKGAHFAVFPPEIPRLCILAGSKPGDVILDPFCGSGTTLFVARELGRHFIGIDLNESFCELSRQRVAGANVPLF